jgi:hypothetical protein
MSNVLGGNKSNLQTPLTVTLTRDIIDTYFFPGSAWEFF